MPFWLHSYSYVVLFGWYLTGFSFPLFSFLALTRNNLQRGCIKIHRCVWILSRWILGFPMSFGIRVTIEISHLLSWFSFINVREVMLWCICHIISLKYFFCHHIDCHRVLENCDNYPGCRPKENAIVIPVKFWSLICILWEEYIYLC